MAKQMPYCYLPLPISFETKREWNKKGYRVMDIAHMPKGYDNPAGKKEPQKANPKK